MILARCTRLVTPIALWLALAASIYSGIEYYARCGPLLLKAAGTEA